MLLLFSAAPLTVLLMKRGICVGCDPAPLLRLRYSQTLLPQRLRSPCHVPSTTGCAASPSTSSYSFSSLCTRHCFSPHTVAQRGLGRS